MLSGHGQTNVVGINVITQKVALTANVEANSIYPYYYCCKYGHSFWTPTVHDFQYLHFPVTCRFFHPCHRAHCGGGEALLWEACDLVFNYYR